MIVIKKQPWEPQQSFTLMHELGHLLLHKTSSIDDEHDLLSPKAANVMPMLLRVICWCRIISWRESAMQNVPTRYLNTTIGLQRQTQGMGREW